MVSLLELLFTLDQDENENEKYEEEREESTWRCLAWSWTRLSDFTFTFHFHALEKEMATRSSVLAWRVPGAVEPGGLTSMGSHRVGHD